MKPKNFLTTMLLLFALVAGSTSAWAGTKKDVLTASDFTATSTSYADFSGVAAVNGSDARYAGNSAKSTSGYIQLRSKSASGIVSTASGGNVKKITVEWDSNTENGRTLNVYGNNVHYSNASELYNNSSQEELIGTIVYGTSTELTITDEYEYIGIRSASGALYLTSVSIEWETSGGGDTPDDPDAPSITIDTYSVNAPATGADGTLTLTYNNFTVDEADVIFCDANGDDADYDWIDAEIKGENKDNLKYSIHANDGEARTAYMKVYALDSEANEAYSGLITITQAKQTLDYAILPFAFDGGKEAIEDIEGLTQEELGSDYSSSPYLKFDYTSDCVILHFNERPGKLTFDIKGNPNNGSWYGTFTVQTSEDGVTYTDLKTYEDLTRTVQHEKFYDLDENVRYIKWIFTTKNSGNVALGNIALAQYVSVPTIITTPAEVEIDAAGDTGTLTVDYYHITTVDADVIFCKANGDEVDDDTYDWIIASINGENNVEYMIDANDGEARTAYMKVYALDDDGNEVYSELITITQAANVAPAVGNQYKLFTGPLVEGDYIIYYDGYAMNNDVQSDRLMFAEVTPDDDDVITTSNAAIVWHIAPSDEYWTIYNAAANAYAAGTGAKNKAMLADGTCDNALWTVSGDDTYEFVNKANAAASVNSYLRKNGTIGFACYGEGTGGDLSLYKKVTVPVTITNAEYATYCNATNALDFSGTGIKVFTATDNENSVKLNEITSGQVPADTPVILYKAGADGTAINVPVIASADAIEGTNDLHVVGTDGLTGEDNIFVLAKINDTVGFYLWDKTKTLNEGKIYLQGKDSYTTTARQFLGFDEGTTAINAVEISNVENKTFYNLAGQRVAQPTKGLYIVNGKKVAIK